MSPILVQNPHPPKSRSALLAGIFALVLSGCTVGLSTDVGDETSDLPDISGPWRSSVAEGRPHGPEGELEGLCTVDDFEIWLERTGHVDGEDIYRGTNSQIRIDCSGVDAAVRDEVGLPDTLLLPAGDALEGEVLQFPQCFGFSCAARRPPASVRIRIPPVSFGGSVRGAHGRLEGGFSLELAGTVGMRGTWVALR